MTVVDFFDRSAAVGEGLFDYLFDLLARPEWHQHAACRGVGADGTKPNVFFPENRANPVTARLMCQRCPVIDQCKAHADSQPETYGIWYGHGTRARKANRRPGRPSGPVAA